jgi:hypothetical protein
MPSRALLTESQTIPAADITQALANIGIARASLSAPVTRTSTTTLSNDGLSALTVDLLPSSRYRVTYRLYFEGNSGLTFGLTFPSALTQFDAELRTYDANNIGVSAIYADWPNQGGASGDVVYDSQTFPGSCGINFTCDITTGSTANTYGNISLLAAQSSSSAFATTITRNACVEVLKFS